jgi:hypothetical protein
MTGSALLGSVPAWLHLSGHTDPIDTVYTRSRPSPRDSGVQLHFQSWTLRLDSFRRQLPLSPPRVLRAPGRRPCHCHSKLPIARRMLRDRMMPRDRRSGHRIPRDRMPRVHADGPLLRTPPTPPATQRRRSVVNLGLCSPSASPGTVRIYANRRSIFCRVCPWELV